MKPGTIVRLPDGREGTVVYKGLDGHGIRWGRITVNAGELYLLHQQDAKGESHDLMPEAMLRDPYPTAIELGLECVGEEYEVVTPPKEPTP
jgi:hypothetical protein